MTGLDSYAAEGVDLAVTLANLSSPYSRGAVQRPGATVAEAGRVRGRGAARLSSRMRAVLGAGSMRRSSLLVNELLADHRAALTLLEGVDGSWQLHLHPAAADAEALDAVKAATGLALSIDRGDFSRIRSCAAPRCDDWFIDRSRNGERRYCTRGCANRVNAQRARDRTMSSALGKPHEDGPPDAGVPDGAGRVRGSRR